VGNRQSTLNPVSGEEIPYLVDQCDGILLVHAKYFDSEHPIVFPLIGVLPDIRESSKEDCLPASRLAECESNFVTSGKNPIYATSLS